MIYLTHENYEKSKKLMTFYDSEDFGEVTDIFAIIQTHPFNFDEESLEMLRDVLSRNPLQGTDLLIIGDLDFIKQYTEHDEYVSYQFDIGAKGLNLDLSAYPEVPRRSFVRSDHPHYIDLYSEEIEREIITTIYHEDAHLMGISDEIEAEEYAQKIVNAYYLEKMTA